MKMPSYKDPKDLARFLLCSSILEGKITNAYKHLVDRTENHHVKNLLNFVHHDTAKHATVLRTMSKNIMRLAVTTKDCEESWGKNWKDIVTSSLEELSKKRRIKNEELTSFIDGMKNLEGFMAESYLTILNLKTLKPIARQCNMDLGNFNTILEWIVEDEKRHEQIVLMIKKIAEKPASPEITFLVPMTE